MVGHASRQEFLNRLGVSVPILQSPMGGVTGPELAIAVSEAGGLGALACAVLSSERMRGDIGIIRQRTSHPFNCNFFAYPTEPVNAKLEAEWAQRLVPYWTERGLPQKVAQGVVGPQTFSEAMCELVEELRPELVSFHFGLPPMPLFARVRATGCLIISSATTVREAVWLEAHGVDAVIAQGWEAGGHRGMFLEADLTSQMGTLALVPQVVDAVDIPVIAAGGIADGRGLAAVLALGAAAAQIGTAFLHTPQSETRPLHRTALDAGADRHTALSNVFTGKPARTIVNRIMREQGPIAANTPPFPRVGAAVGPLREVAEAEGKDDFTPMWAGQGFPLRQSLPASALVEKIWSDAKDVLSGLRLEI